MALGATATADGPAEVAASRSGLVSALQFVRTDWRVSDAEQEMCDDAKIYSL